MQPPSKGYVALVGSRDATLDQLELMIRLGRTWQDLGLDPSSGDAYGNDRAGWWGARQSPNYDEDKARIYLLESKRNRSRAMEFGFTIAEDFPECWTMATAIALEARGSWNGLPQQYQRDLHIRNVYQIFGHTLDVPVKAIMYCAKPIGKQPHDRCSGGTNTALQVAKRAGVPVMVNTYTDEGIRWSEEFLKRYEQPYEYDEIEWREILKPDDPRLEYL